MENRIESIAIDEDVYDVLRQFDTYYKAKLYIRGPFMRQGEVEELRYEVNKKYIALRDGFRRQGINMQVKPIIDIPKELAEEGYSEGDARVILIAEHDIKSNLLARHLQLSPLEQYYVTILDNYTKELYTGTLPWMSKEGHILDKRQPVGDIHYITDSYRVSENGVVQSEKMGNYFSNMDGTNEKVPVVHLKDVGNVPHVFLTKEELLAATFLDDPKDPNSVLVYIDENAGIKKSNLQFVKNTKKTKRGRSRSKIYTDTGVLLEKKKGKEEPITEVLEYVNRERTSDWLRTLKNKHRDNAGDFCIALNGKNVIRCIPKEMAKVRKYRVIGDVDDILSNTGKLTVNQANFYFWVNELARKTKGGKA